MGYVYVLMTVAFTVLSQLLVKWRISSLYPNFKLPEQLLERIIYLFKTVLLDPIIIFCIGCTFFSGLAWMAAMTKLPISLAYPLTSLGYVLVLGLSCLLLGETFNAFKLVGVILIMAGVFVSSQG